MKRENRNLLAIDNTCKTSHSRFVLFIFEEFEGIN